MRSCFLVLTALKSYLASGERQAEFAVCQRLCDMIESYKRTSMDDILPTYPHVLRVLTQVLSRSVSAADCKILNIGFVTQSLRVMDSILTLIMSSKDRLQSILGNYKKESLSFMILVTGVLEALKVSNKYEPSDIETVGCASFACFGSMITFYVSSEMTATDAKIIAHHGETAELKGPHLAQIIQSCLHFSKHPSKQLAIESLKCLTAIINSVENSTEWRKYFPGVFSGLHIVCMAGYKR